MRGYYDRNFEDIRSLVNKSRALNEQVSIDRINVAKDIEDKISQDTEDYKSLEPNDREKESPDDKIQKYRISGGIIALHGKEKPDVEITSDEKLAFQETMDEFVDEVSDLVDFNELNVYTNSVEWSGKIIDEDVEFILTIGENSGIYIDGANIKVDDEFLELINKMQQFYQKFKSKWSKILASRKVTRTENED
jgi:hypothetical protein